MSILQKKKFNFKSIYNPRRLSLSTRIEIMRKKRLVRLAKKMLQEGMQTPRADSYQENMYREDTRRTIDALKLTYLLENAKECESSSAYSSDEFEQETEAENASSTDEEEANVTTNEKNNDDDKKLMLEKSVSDDETTKKLQSMPLLVDEEAEIIEEENI